MLHQNMLVPFSSGTVGWLPSSTCVVRKKKKRKKENQKRTALVICIRCLTGTRHRHRYKRGMQTHVKAMHFSETQRKAGRECVMHDASETTGPKDHPFPSKHVHTGRGILKDVSGERLFSHYILQGTEIHMVQASLSFIP